MKIEQVHGFNGFPQYNKSTKKASCNSTQNPNLSFGSSNAISNYPVSGQWESVFAKFENIYPKLIKNKYQIGFLNKILESGIGTNHPIAEHMELCNPLAFWYIMKQVETEENLNTKNYAFNFLMKHPDFCSELEGANQFWYLADAKYSPQQDFLEFVDNNYDRLSQNKDFIKDLRFLFVNIKSSKEKTALYKNFLKTIMAKYTDDSFKGLFLGHYVHAINNEYAAQYVVDMLPARLDTYDRQFFLNWYFINGISTQKQKDAAINLYNKVIELRTENPNFRLRIPPDNMMAVLNNDENLSTEELLTIDERYADSRKHDPKDENIYFLNRLCRAYGKAKGRAEERVEYNEYNRKFLYYIMEQEPWEKDDKYSKSFLSKEFMESINTEEQYNKACALYQAIRTNFENFPKRVSRFFPMLFGQYGMKIEDIINIEKLSNGIPDWLNWKKGVNEYLQSIGKPAICEKI